MDQTDRIPYEEALALKEIGYSWPCSALFEISLTEQIDEQDGKSGPFGWEKGEVNYRVDYFVNNLESVDWSNKDWLIVGAPIWQRAFKWFRDKHNLLVKPDKYPRKGYYFVIMNTKRVYDFRGFGNYKDIYTTELYKTYEEAELACLRKLIEIVKNGESNSKSK